MPREVQLCNILIDGATQLIKWENMIEEGDKAAAEAEIEAMVGVQRLSFGRSHSERSIHQNLATLVCALAKKETHPTMCLKTIL